MYKILRWMAVSINLAMLTFFAFFFFSIIEEGKANNMAGADTLIHQVVSVDGVETVVKPTNLVIDDQEATCMAMNIYHEARSDNLAGQYAVADVTLNRVHDDRYPNTICKVVMEGKMKESWKTKQDPDLLESDRKYIPVRNMCQFSWWCDGKSDTPKDETGWAQAQYVANAAIYTTKFRGLTEGSTHYHATYVKPKWISDRGMNHTGRIGSHIFYRWD